MGKRVFALAGVVFAMFFSGCAASPPRTTSRPAVAGAIAVAPPYRDPEYVLRFAVPDQSEWEERRNIDGGDGAPDPILRLTHRSNGAVIDVLFVPKTEGDPEDWANEIRRSIGDGAVTFTPVVLERDGGLASFRATAGDRVTRHAVIRLRGMARSLAYLRMTSPTASLARASVTFDAALASMSLDATGPLTPQGRLARCLTEKGVRLYSAWWCGPCRMQMEMFGEDGASRVDHLECSNPGEHDQRRICGRANIASYPTWVFPDGTRLEGVQDLGTLAEHAGCARPE